MLTYNLEPDPFFPDFSLELVVYVLFSAFSE